MLIHCHSLNTWCKENTPFNNKYASPMPISCQQMQFNLWEADAHIFWLKIQRAILNQTHQEGNWEPLQHYCSASETLLQSGTKTGLMPAPKIPPLECNLLRDFSLLSLLLRSTPGRLSENGPSNSFLIFQTSKLIVNYLSRISRWALKQSSQRSALL